MDERFEKTTAEACSQQDCEGCEIQGKLLCIHTPKDLIDFFVLFIGWFIPFLAGMIIGSFWIGLAVWVGLAVIFFGYIEALVLCRHCPHYAEKGFLLRCHANWGLPKIPKFDPHPLNFWEKAIWLFYVAVLFLYYIPFFIISQQWLLLVLTTTAFFAAAWTLQRTKCNRCYNLSCPINRVPDDVKKAFFKNYPVFCDAWDAPEPEEEEEWPDTPNIKSTLYPEPPDHIKEPIELIEFRKAWKKRDKLQWPIRAFYNKAEEIKEKHPDWDMEFIKEKYMPDQLGMTEPEPVDKPYPNPPGYALYCTRFLMNHGSKTYVTDESPLEEKDAAHAECFEIARAEHPDWSKEQINKYIMKEWNINDIPF